MAENEIVKNTVDLCDNRISEYIYDYTNTIITHIKNANSKTPFTADKSDTVLRALISSDLGQYVTSLSNLCGIEKSINYIYPCKFLFYQCFQPEINEIINDLVKIEFPVDETHKEYLTRRIGEKYNFNGSDTEELFQLIEKKHNKVINQYTEEIFKCTSNENPDMTIVERYDIESKLNGYSTHMKNSIRNEKSIIRKYDCPLLLNYFTTDVKDIINDKQSILNSKGNDQLQITTRVRDKLSKSKI